MGRVRRYSGVVKVKTTTHPSSGQVVLTEAGQCMGSQSETKTVT
jgi:hypothetical protein